MLTLQAEAYSNELFYCVSCKHSFQAQIATWVDVSREPRAKTLLLNWEFNVTICPRCGNRIYSESPFFFEDFAEGLLVAVFPIIPENHASVESHIRRQYAYYPTLEFFYDMSQLWFLIYLQEYYKKTNINPRVAPKTGFEEKRLKIILHFLKKDPLMLTIRDTLIKTFLGHKTNDDLQNVVWRALVKLEGMSPDCSEIPASIMPRVT